MGSRARALAMWLSLPFTRHGRSTLGWMESSGISEAARSSGTLPQVTWSQDGEDLLFEELFPATGFYVDVGAHHPDRYSVTRKLYDRGWHGVNIDFSPGFAEAFAQRRPRDRSIAALVGTPREAVFFRFAEPTLSTLDEHRARQLVDLGWPIVAQESVQVEPLSTVLERLDVTGAIDLLSVDVEGEDLAVIGTLDWDRWPVERCLVEIVLPAYEVLDHPVARFLVDRGLRLTRVWGRSCLFERDFQHDPLQR